MSTIKNFPGCCGMRVLYHGDLSVGLEDYQVPSFRRGVTRFKREGIGMVMVLTDYQIGDSEFHANWQKENVRRMKKELKRAGFKKVARYKNRHKGNFLNVFVFNPSPETDQKLVGW